MTAVEELRAAAARFERLQGPAAPALVAWLRCAAEAVETYPALAEPADSDGRTAFDAEGVGRPAYQLLADQVACARDVAQASLTGVRP